MIEARYYRRRGEWIHCLLCPHRCCLKEGQTGFCRVRKVQDGRLFSLNHGICAAACFDPTEKKPLYHFYPGREIFSLGTFGCNLSCRFCQNWQMVSSGSKNGYALTPGEVLETLLQQSPARQLGVAYTYAEPVVWYEFVLETARLLSQNGFCNVMITNGFIEEEPLGELLQYIDAMNIDVKAFRPEFYEKWCDGDKEVVLKTVEQAQAHCHVEITYLLIPTLNDSEKEIRELSCWLAEMDPEIPLHFSRYFPRREMDLPPTPLKTLEKAREIASERMSYVYIGNVGEHEGNNTYCPKCRALLVKRSGYLTKIEGVLDNHCRSCGCKVPFVL